MINGVAGGNEERIGEEFPVADKLKIDKHFVPCLVDDEDELFANGIFEFNITKMTNYILCDPGRVSLDEVAVGDFFVNISTINESHLASVELSQPIIVAEIAPGRYNVIDGNHRMEKARRAGIPTLTAYKVPPEQHMKFLICKEAYVAYVEYWNSKLIVSRPSRQRK